MQPSSRAPQTMKFYGGWRLVLRRLSFLVHSLRYAVQRRRYPLFTYNPFRNGFLKTVKIGWWDLRLRKSAKFNGSHFTTLTMPHYPSAAYDHMVARGGLNIGAAGTSLKQHMDTVILAITRRCDLHCRHCYERFQVGDQEIVPTERWKEVIRQVQEAGCSIVVLSGGEPMLRYETVLQLLRSGNKDLSDFHIHTSGQGVTTERAREMKAAGLTAAAVGLDDVDPNRHDRLRGFPGAQDMAVNALRILHDEGIFTYVNLCLSRDLIRSGDLWKYYELVRSLNVGFIQLLEPRPCGGYLGADAEVLLTEPDRERAMQFYLQANTRHRYRNYPVVHYVAFAESANKMGCLMGGLSHLYIDSLGNVNPCVFLPVTFGNIVTEDFGPIFGRIRKAVPRPIHRLCPSLMLGETLHARHQRGGGFPVPQAEIRKEWNSALGI